MAKKKIGLPPLDWLRVFEAAGRLGGFSAAAKEFGSDAGSGQPADRKS